MENELEVKTHELTNIRDQFLRFRFEFAQLKFRAEQTARASRVSAAAAERFRSQIDQAYAIIARRNDEIRELRELIAELGRRMKPLAVQSALNRMAEDEGNAASMKEYRRRVSVIEMGSPATVVAAAPIAPVAPIAPGLRMFLARQERSIAMWNARKNSIMKQQREQMLLILRGMRLAIPLSPPARPNTPPRIVPVAQPALDTRMVPTTIVQTCLKIPPAWKARLRECAALGRTVPKPNTEFDMGVMRTSSADPELPHQLTRGVVAVPLSEQCDH
jgi:hypothetical protein